MKVYYDDKRYYPYLCINDASNHQLKELVNKLKQISLEPVRYYSDPKYPASDNIRYRHVFKLPFTDNRIKKPNKKEIEVAIQSLLGVENNVPQNLVTKDNQEVFSQVDPISSNSDQNQIEKDFIEFVKSEKEYLGQLKSILETERVILQTDKEFFKEQLDKLGKISKDLQKEKNNLVEYFDSIGSKFTADIDQLIKKQTLENDDIEQLRSTLLKKEELINEKEKNIRKREKDFEAQQKDFEEYKVEQERNFKERVDSLNALNFGFKQEDQTDKEKLESVKILVIGQSSLTKKEIQNIFMETFDKNIEVQIPMNSIEVPTTDYEKMKNVNIKNYFKNDKFNYMLFGPRPHSMKGINLRKSPITIVKEFNLKAKIFVENDKELSRNVIEEFAKNISENWKAMH